MVPRITLVGAGPGDPDLLTVGGLAAIRTADVVLYDALVSPAILGEIPAAAMPINVGKRAGSHSMTQEDINDLMVAMARKHGHVVRLKGGDPFVFGRGFEELHYAASKGIPVRVIPGVTSAIAAPASFNIPVTLRDVSDGLYIVTGTNRNDEISSEVAIAAEANCTVVILMGLGRIAEIMNEFISTGKDQLPVAVISNATLMPATLVTGVVKNIATKVKQANVQPPAVIVVGDVVGARERLEALHANVLKSFPVS